MSIGITEIHPTRQKYKMLNGMFQWNGIVHTLCHMGLNAKQKGFLQTVKYIVIISFQDE